jgi:hypothetical protein
MRYEFLIETYETERIKAAVLRHAVFHAYFETCLANQRFANLSVLRV